MAWYEVVTEVNRVYQLAIEEEYGTFLDAVIEAQGLSAALRADLDLGSWSVTILAHWCPRDGYCKCGELRLEDTPFDMFEGMTIPLMFTTGG